MQTKDVTIRLQALDGTWETCGSDRARGIVPENVVLSADGWGSKTASFDLRRDPKAAWPDIGAFTPVKVEIGGQLRWSGRVKETPSRDGADRVMSVQCEGWQAHLDDDLYERVYVHRNMGDWKDSRSFLGENLALFTTAGQVGSGEGAITIGWPNGAVLSAGANVGVKLDLGPGNTAAAIAVEVKGVTGPANSGAYLFAVGSATDFYFGSGSNSPFADAALSVIGTNANLYEGNLPTPTRYVTVGLYVPSAVTLNGDVTLQITGLTVVTDPAFITAASSNTLLKAPTVIRDALNRATVLLSTDRSLIDPDSTVSFSIPSLAPGEPKTPREMWEAVNAYHDYMSKIDVHRRPVFLPKPARPKYTVGAWSPMELEDSSQNSGEDIYNRAIVTATSPAGESLRVERTAAATTYARAAVTPVDTSKSSGTGTSVSTVFSGTFQKGRRYRLTFALTWGGSRVSVSMVSAGDDGVTVPIYGPYGPYGVSGSTFTVDWTPTGDRAGSAISFRAAASGAGATVAFNGLTVTTPVSGLLDRRLFRRSKQVAVATTMPADGVAMAQIGDTWLKAHVGTPFKGTNTIVGDEAVRDRLSGTPVPCDQLLLDTGELLHFSDRVHPDSGGIGRDGRMVNVTYDHNKNEVSVALDNTRSNFEALLARLAVVTGGGS